MHRGAQRVESAGDGRLGLSQEVGEGGIRRHGRGELRLPELHESDDEPLLGAVVEVAFDPTALDLIGRDDLPSRGRELSDPPGGEGLVRGRGPVEPSLRKGELHAPKVPCLVSPCPRRRDPTKVYPALLLPECGHYRDRIGDTME